MGKRNILIVEDNELQQTLYSALSRKFDLTISMVKSCKDAVAALEDSADFHLVLMDLGLADINGCECAKRIRLIEQARGTHTPIVAVTGHTSDDYKKDCFDAGMDGFLSKPFSIDQFGDTLKQWCRNDEGDAS